MSCRYEHGNDCKCDYLEIINLLQRAYYLIDDLVYELYHEDEDRIGTVLSVEDWMRDTQEYGAMNLVLIDAEELDDEDEQDR